MVVVLYSYHQRNRTIRESNVVMKICRDFGDHLCCCRGRDRARSEERGRSHSRERGKERDKDRRDDRDGEALPAKKSDVGEDDRFRRNVRTTRLSLWEVLRRCVAVVCVARTILKGSKQRWFCRSMVLSYVIMSYLIVSYLFLF